MEYQRGHLIGEGESLGFQQVTGAGVRSQSEEAKIFRAAVAYVPASAEGSLTSPTSLSLSSHSLALLCMWHRKSERLIWNLDHELEAPNQLITGLHPSEYSTLIFAESAPSDPSVAIFVSVCSCSVTRSSIWVRLHTYTSQATQVHVESHFEGP